MPLGFERLNERSQRPNAHINFIKPLPSNSPQDQKIAQDFLERIAAQCYPVMKREHISVMALEEYAPNPEFLGRNFNAGEVVQLVLKDKSGRWLSFKFVQMVMMHELAHCKQMNHSRAFWQVRNQYADHMKELWTQRYEGEGVWGRGQNLISGDFVHDRMPDDADIPEHLCGGTYRRGRGRKRKRGQSDADPARPTYAERQQKRIKKKFGKHGEGHDLGEDELVRGALEKGKSRPGKPRVANSKRGRELRASAALARFDAAKNQQARERTTDTTPELIEDGDSETESEEDLDDPYADGLNILETLVRIKDQRGRDLYQVCGDEGGEDEGGEEEMEELKMIGANTTSAAEGVDAKTRQPTSDQPPQRKTSPIRDVPTTASSHQTTTSSNVSTCPICSLDNEASSATCMACSHVLKPSLMKSHWRCKSSQCHGSAYINAGDAGRCGLCGGLKPAAGNDKPMGLVGADVLRWD
ncbi:WLM domain-containing protein [Neohortaea acidophila]|uniref:WLM domain-containing protein n=1 Tax=Neohortaea acidophila TaxID=245834 RepID=A0A6A6PQL5_9PEZI|nr:WLM domain-containing protein [Neohortaea acidophila]KAF2481924.1 WLM domain-containing protein [Neohortaea acidophila]